MSDWLRWCVPQLPAIGEAERRASQAQGQPGQLRLSQTKNQKGLGV